MKSQKIREKVPCPLKDSYTLKISQKWMESFIFVDTCIYQIRKMGPPQQNFFSGLLNFFQRRICEQTENIEKFDKITCFDAISRKMRIL